jgi:hypothetical protein
MRRHRALEELERIRDYFKDVPSYALSKQERTEEDVDDQLGLTYGETSVNLSTSLMGWAGLRVEDVFCDFGSGAGIPTLVASNFCQDARGVEILSSLVKVSEKAAKALGYENATFEEADFADVNVTDVTFLFAYSTCFPAALMEIVEQKALETAPEARVLITNHRFDNAGFVLEKRDFWTWKDPGSEWEMPMEVNLYKRVETS